MIEIKLNLNREPGQKYPYVGVFNKGCGEYDAVLFTKENTGTLLKSTGNYYSIGHHSESWLEELYYRYTNEIRIIW